MIISTRGRYALRVMIDLAENQGDSYIPMKDVAARQGISLKYLEQILPVLTKNKLVEAVHGKGGGYRLTREPKDYTTLEILKLTENELAAVTCLAEGAEPCSQKDKCRTLDFWKNFNDVVNNYLSEHTLESFLTKNN